MITIASRAVAPKSTIPALEGVLLEAEQELNLTGYNLKTGIRGTISADIAEPGSIVLSARLFGDIIRRLPTVWDETVVLPQSEIGRLAVIARRKGGTWYIAGVNTAPAAVTIPAGLIPATARKAQIVRDAANGSLQTAEVALPAPEPLVMQLPENGGFIVVLE